MGWLGFPGRISIAQDCRLCAQAASAPICTGCDADLTRLPVAVCPNCALPSPSGARCGRCLAEPPAFDSTRAALEYVFPATRLIQAFKYGGAVGLAAPLAGFLEAALRTSGEPLPDLLLAMPLARQRLAERGYNQSLEIARVLAKRLGVQVDPRGVARSRHGPPQADLPLPERRRNVRGAFRTTRRFDGLDVAVVDDVMTTGATLDELAAALKKGGAARVRSWVVARTLL